jgi:sugar/nucleoside kinase (ribokinase family)
MMPKLVVLGNLAVDDIVYPDGQTRMGQPGGAALYVALGANLWEPSVGLVSRVGSAYPRSMLEALSQRGIDLDGVREIEGPGLRTWLLYEGELRRVIHRLDCATHDEASPVATDIPVEWDPRAIHLAPMPIDLQSTLVDRLAHRPDLILSADPYELLTESTLGRWAGITSLLDHFFVSEDEVVEGRWREDPTLIVSELRSGRLRNLFYKQGSRGGIVFDKTSENRFDWSSRAESIVDSTGAGDAFAGGTLTGLLDGEPADIALRRGIVSASFALAGQGSEALMAATADTAEIRLREWFPDR